MSVVVCRSSPAPFPLENAPPPTMLKDTPLVLLDNKEEEQPGQLDIWSMIQSQKATPTSPADPMYKPLVRRSSSGLMSQKSLEMCTESLGSETGSEDFSPISELVSSDEDKEDVTKETKKAEEIEEVSNGKKKKKHVDLPSVNYHCSVTRRSTAPRSFPPPLTSISRRDGSCIHMKTHRNNGRLVVEAVAVPSQNYLHARRQEGRLLLSFIDTTTETNIQHSRGSQTEREEEERAAAVKEVVGDADQDQEEPEEEYDEEIEEEEEEEQVEVVDRGTMVEVKVSTQPQQSTGAMKVLRSSLFINKFVGGTPQTNKNRWPEPQQKQTIMPEHEDQDHHGNTSRRAAATTTAAAAAVAASSASASSEVVGQHPPLADNKLLFTSKRRNREELLHHMRRCSELRRPLFFWEPGCIATST